MANFFVALFTGANRLIYPPLRSTAFLIVIALAAGSLAWLSACSDQVKKRAVNDPCIANTDCADKICHLGICASSTPKDQGQTCTGNGECKSFICKNGICAKGTAGLGTECLHDQECSSGLCKLGKCASGSSDGGLDGSGGGPDGPDAATAPDAYVLNLKLVSVSSGTFTMGAPSSDLCRDTVFKSEAEHTVTLTRGIKMAESEVTQGQFKALMGYNPSLFGPGGPQNCGLDCPVESISWHEAAAFCNALSSKEGKTACYGCTGKGASVACVEAPAFGPTNGKKIYDCPGYRLPTDAEWEHAYRAGSKTPLYKTPTCDGTIKSCTGSDPNTGLIGWYLKNSSVITHLVKQKQPNAWGLYDMAGNVQEWCHDGFVIDLSTLGSKDPVIGAKSTHVVHGGGATDPPRELRAASRLNLSPVLRNANVGFRYVITVSP